MLRRLLWCTAVSVVALGAGALCWWLAGPVPHDSVGTSALFALAWLFTLVPLAAVVVLFDRTAVLVIVIGITWLWGLLWLLIWLFAGPVWGPAV